MSRAHSEPVSSVRTSRKAIFSLILALLGFSFSLCVGLFSSIPAIVLGHMALSNIKRSGGALGGRTYAVMGLILGYLVIVVNILFVMRPGVPSREEALSATCRNNLKQLSVCLSMYRREHDGEYPRLIADLYPEYLEDPMVGVCPSSGTEAGDLATMDQWMDYTYFPAPADINDVSQKIRRPITLADGSEKPRIDTPDTRVVVLQDRAPVHSSHGRNKAFADGHVEFVPEPGRRESWWPWGTGK